MKGSALCAALGIEPMRTPTRWERFCWKITGRWPWSYVAERLDHAARLRIALNRLPTREALDILSGKAPPALLKDSDA